MGVWTIRTAVEASPELKGALTDEEITAIEQLTREIKVGKVLDNLDEIGTSTTYEEVIIKLKSLKEES